jgi:hypothetical protein
LSTSLYGLTTIRAFKTEPEFIKQFDDYQDMHTATWYIFIAITRWFGIWLDWISVTFIAFVTYSFLMTDFASKFCFLFDAMFANTFFKVEPMWVWQFPVP